MAVFRVDGCWAATCMVAVAVYFCRVRVQEIDRLEQDLKDKAQLVEQTRALLRDHQVQLLYVALGLWSVRVVMGQRVGSPAVSSGARLGDSCFEW